MTSILRKISIVRYLQLGMAALFALFMAACGGGAGTVGIASGTTLFTTAPSAISVPVGTAVVYTIGGGTPIYSVTSSSPTVAIGSLSGTGTTLTILGKVSGVAQISIRDAVGAVLTISVTVGSGGTTALFTTAPSALTISAGGTASFSIGGGSAPYRVSTNNATIATAGVKGTKLNIIGVASGTAQIAVFDATGASVTIAVTVGSGTATALFTTAPSPLTIAVGVTSTFNIGGGKPAYQVSSSNSGVAKVAINGTAFIITGVAAGSAQIAVFDSAGASVTINVTVGSGGTVSALYTTAASAITVGVGSEATFDIGGGVAPYRSTSSNTTTATTGVSGTTLSVDGVAAGTAQVLVFDATGASVTIAVTVTGSATPVPPALFTTAPSTITVAIGGSGSYSIGGGTAPYASSSSNTGVATASVAGTTLTITGVGAGTAQVLVLDSTGTSVTIAVTVGSGGSSTALFTTAASATTIAIGAAPTYKVGGGTAPYSATSSNTGVATASVAGTTLTITGVAAGSAQVLVFDSTGASVTIAVTVGSGATATPLFTTAASTVTIGIGSTNNFTIGGGTAPYVVTSNNTSVARATVSGGTTLGISGVAAGSAQILVFDAAGASVTIGVTVSQVSLTPVDVQPNGATGNVGDVLQFIVSGGAAPYSITVNNVSIATVSPTSVGASGGSFSATLLNAGSTDVTIVDSTGQIKAFTLTASQLSVSLRLSPSVLVIGEDSTNNIDLNIYGGTAPYRAFTSDQTLSSVSVSGSILTVGLGSNLGRCINPVDSSGVHIPTGTFDVTITVVDNLGASATSTMTIKDNGASPGTSIGPPPCN